MISFKLATIKKGKQLISEDDQYLRELLPHEYALKMNKNKQVNRDEFIDFLKSCVLEWQERESLKLKCILTEITQDLNLRINMVKPIYIVKTSGLEEWNSAYTRENAIIIPLNRINDSKITLKKLLIHEVFHVISKQFSSIKNKLYYMLGYEKINSVILTDKLKKIKLTNPDAPTLNYFTWVYVKDGLKPVVPIVLLKEDRDNIDCAKDILESIITKMIVVEEKAGCFNINEKSEMITRHDIIGYKNKTLKHINQFEHPEEILANLFTQFIMGEDSYISHELLNEFYKSLIRK